MMPLRSNAAMEHRWGRRIACGAPVRLDIGAGAPADGRLRDVSMSGAFIETTLAPALFAAIELTMLRANGTRVRRRGHVVRLAPDGSASGPRGVRQRIR